MGTQPPPPRKGAYYKHIQALHKDQHRSIQQKHSQEMLLLDSIKGFFKQRFALERQHFEALSKICSSQYRAFDCIKKLPTKDPNNPEVQPYESNIYSVWVEMLQSIEEKASNYVNSLVALETEILKDVKKLKACKQQRMKKFFERVAFLHKELEGSVTELDRTKRIYFNEESEALETKEKAKDADEIARGKKKDIKSFFQSHSTLKKAAGKLSVKQDEFEIRSTGARNDYILSLSTANAHQHRYFKNDLPEIVQLLEADIYNKVKNYYKKYIEAEIERVRNASELFDDLDTKTTRTTRETNFQLFCVAYPSLSEHVTYTFENCPGDTTDKITTSEHDGGYSLNYEARQSASKLNQAVKTINAFEKRIEACQYHRSKGLTREPNDTGGPDLETKIVELQIAIGNAKTDKAKAEARLDKLREGGIAVDEYIDAFVMERKRQQEAAEAQRARDAAAAAAAAEGAANDDEDNFDLREAHADSFDEEGRAEPQMAATSYEQPTEDNWASWDDAPATTTVEVVEQPPEDDWAAFDNQEASADTAAADVPETNNEPVSFDGLQQVNVLFNFDAQNNDELTISENEVVYLSNEECDEEGWAVCINANGQKGYVPLNYLDFGNNGEQAAEDGYDANNAVPQQDELQQPVIEEATDPFASSGGGAAVGASNDDDNWGFNQFQTAQPQPPSQPPPTDTYPPWQASFDDAAANSSDEDEDESEATDTMPPPPDMPPPIPDCPPPIHDFSKSASISIDNSLSTFGTDYCVGMYDYDATGSDEISFKAGDKIKILNRIPNGVDDGWWKGLVKNGEHAGKQGLFPSIICEPLSDSDSCNTDDSIESPTSSCAPPPMSPPKTPMLTKDNSLAPQGSMEIVVTAPTPTVQSPVAPERPAMPPPPPVPQQPPAQPPRPVAAPTVNEVAKSIPQVVIQPSEEEVTAISSDSENEEEEKLPEPPPQEEKEEEEPEAARVESPPKAVEKSLQRVERVDSSDYSDSDKEASFASAEPPPPAPPTTQPQQEAKEEQAPSPPPPQQPIEVVAKAASPPPITSPPKSETPEAKEDDSNNARSLQRVDTADSSSTDSSAEGPVARSSEDDSDSSDHVPPEDLHVKQLKKLDTLKESSA